MLNGARVAGAVCERILCGAGSGSRKGARADGVVDDWNEREAARPLCFLLQGSIAGATKVYQGLSFIVDAY